MIGEAQQTRDEVAARPAARLRARPALLDPAFERLRERVSQGALSTAALAVGDADGLIRSDAFTNESRPVSVDKIFFLASVTKPIVATAFMQLVEAGRFGLHQPFAEIEPRMSGGGREKVTPWHVLTHTSGVADHDLASIARKRPDAAALTRLAIDSPLGFEPGTRWSYCSASFYLLTMTIERITGQRYVDYLDEHLLHQLGMQATFDPRRWTKNIVPVQGVGIDSRWRRYLVLRWMAKAALPGGGLFGTLDDLMRFGAAVLRPRQAHHRLIPLKPETITEMGRDQTRGIMGESDGEERPVHFGLGWGKPTLMRDVPGSETVISHGGASGTRLWIDPDAGLVFVFFTNRWSSDRGVETEALRQTYAAMAVDA